MDSSRAAPHLFQTPLLLRIHFTSSRCGHEMCQYGGLRKHCRWTAGSTTSINDAALYGTVYPSIIKNPSMLKKRPQGPDGMLKKRPPGPTKKKTLRIAPYKRYPSIIRIPGFAPEEEPDMVSLGLPFTVCQKVFIQLSLTDLASCMLVCKEWRSFIDTCDFWRYLLQRTYDLNLQTPPKWSVLRQWRHRTSCLKICVTPTIDLDPVKPQSYVFRPFLEMWRCGIVVPYGQEPPDGSVEKLHGFLQAMNWLARLNVKIEELDVRKELNIEPCLMPWSKDRMPTTREVLDGFNAHIEIIRSACDAQTLTPQELRSYYGLLRSRYRGPRFSDQLYYWFTDNARRTNLIFDCDPDVVDPTPSFILTRLSPGWVGGAIYAV